jgi:4a-hydroxytetrahydrobiopterin dehydratase
MNNLTNKRCVPCEGGIDPIKLGEAKKLLLQLKGWKLVSNKKLKKEFHFINFKHTMDFVNRIALLAETEKHHPDMVISYANLKIELFTHAISGLSENDFILAAKIDQL